MATTKISLGQLEENAPADAGLYLRVDPSTQEWVRDGIDSSALVLPASITYPRTSVLGKSPTTGEIIVQNPNSYVSETASLSAGINNNLHQSDSLDSMQKSELSFLTPTENATNCLAGLYNNDNRFVNTYGQKRTLVNRSEVTPIFLLKDCSESEANERFGKMPRGITPLLPGTAMDVYYSSDSKFDCISPVQDSLDGFNTIGYKLNPAISTLNEQYNRTLVGGATFSLDAPNVSGQLSSTNFKMAVNNLNDVCAFYAPSTFKYGLSTVLYRAMVFIEDIPEVGEGYDLSVMFSNTAYLGQTAPDYSAGIKMYEGSAFRTFMRGNAGDTFAPTGDLIEAAADTLFVFEVLLHRDGKITGYVNGKYVGTVTISPYLGNINYHPSIHITKYSSTLNTEKVVRVTQLDINIFK